jgi:hypothetical protein
LSCWMSALASEIRRHRSERGLSPGGVGWVKCERSSRPPRIADVSRVRRCNGGWRCCAPPRLC